MPAYLAEVIDMLTACNAGGKSSGACAERYRAAAERQEAGTKHSKMDVLCIDCAANNSCHRSRVCLLAREDIIVREDTMLSAASHTNTIAVAANCGSVYIYIYISVKETSFSAACKSAE